MIRTTDSCRRALALTASLAILLGGCRENPLGPQADDARPLAGKKPGGAGYGLLVLDPLPGQSHAGLVDINDAHEAVGVAHTTDGTGACRSVAVFWQADELAPVPLPDLPGAGASAASDVNERGEVSGTSGSVSSCGGYIYEAVPVIWSRAGSGWTVRSLAGTGGAAALNDAGEASGSRTNELQDSEAVFWGADGITRVLPLPDGLANSHASGINADGDVVGDASTRSGLQYGIAWVRTGPATWDPVVLEGGPAKGVTGRRPDGSFTVAGVDDEGSGCCVAVRWTVGRDASGGGWRQTSREVLGRDLFRYGTAGRVNDAGDVAGAGAKTNWGPGTGSKALLFPASGSTVALPMSRGASGSASGISSDRWLVGQMDGRAVVWMPGS